jgi:hypothetical protein
MTGYEIAALALTVPVSVYFFALARLAVAQGDAVLANERRQQLLVTAAEQHLKAGGRLPQPGAFVAGLGPGGEITH